MEKMLPVYYLLLYKALICIKSSVNMDDFIPKSNLCAIHCIYNTANGIYNRNVCMNLNHIKRKIDIEKKYKTKVH